MDVSYAHYAGKGDFDYTDEDFTDCYNWMQTALTYKNGMFNPLNLDIVSPERYFDLELKYDWAKYRYDLPGKPIIEGYLSIKGTLDLVVRKANNIIELIDWKTGRPKNWATGENKTWENLHDDPQLRLYHYAAAQLYPEAKEIFITIYYIKFDMPITLCLERADLVQTENMIRKQFELMRDTKVPALIYPDFKCFNWCHFGQNSFNGPTKEYDKSICKAIKDEILELGIERVTVERSKDKSFEAYVEGGGRTHE
jgi:hypothetical protein